MRRALVLVAVVALAGCGSDGKPVPKPAKATPSQQPAEMLMNSDVDVLPSKGQTCAEAIAELPAEMRDKASCADQQP
jgi:predicted small lipoprotein YifL